MRSKKAVKNILISVLLQIITILCGFIVPKLIINSYGSKVNGLLSSITQFLAYITLLEAGVGPVVKSALFKPISKKDQKEIASILLASEKFFKKIARIFLLYIAFLCLLYPSVINQEFNSFFSISLIVIISLSTLTEYYFGITYRVYLAALQEVYMISFAQIIVTILNTLGIILFIYLGFNIQFVKLMSAMLFVIKPILLTLYVKKKYSVDLKLAERDYKLEKKWDGLAQHIANIIHENTDVVVLTLLTTMTDVSIYAVYMLVIKGIKSLIEALTSGIDSSFGDMIARNEQENLNKSFQIYEFLYHTFITIICISTMLLIVPFVKVYTSSVTDANYVRPLFGFLISLACFIYEIRLPYSLLTVSAGKFKETRNGAWVEAGVNVVVSLILTMRYGLNGVAIGTIMAVLIRTIEFMLYISNHILDRKKFDTFKWLFIILFETIIIYLINSLFLSNINITTYGNWGLYAIIIVFITSLFVLVVNCMLNKNVLHNFINVLKRK